MAGEQDIVSLGLNIDSFNSQKKKTLQEYIKLFNDLSKYDGKIFNPVMGDGLTAFNTSISATNKLLEEMNARMSSLTASLSKQAAEQQSVKLGLSETGKEIVKTDGAQTKATRNKKEEDKATKDLTNDYILLRKALQDQIISYQNLAIAKGKDHAATKAALADIAATSTVINSIDKQVSKASAGASGFGRSLGTAFGYLRNIAYILPGIGIAGIFNLIFDAVDKAVDSMGLFVSKSEKVAKTTIDVNKRLSEQLSIYYELNKLRNEFSDNFGGTSLGGFSYIQQQLKDAVDAATGMSKDKLFPKEIETAKSRLATASASVGGDANQEKFFGDESLKRMEKSAEIMQEINKQRRAILSTGLFKPEDLKKFDVLLEAEKSNYDIEKTKFEKSRERLKEFYDATQDLSVKQAQYEKFKADEKRRLSFETAKNEISVNIEKNKKILDDDRNFHSERERAIRAIYNQSVSLAGANLANVTSNNSSTNADKGIAGSTYNSEVEKANIKLKQDLYKNDVEFYQRRLLALTEIQKDEVEQVAIANERIFLNEKHSMSERLDAYEDYIIGKQKIKDLEHSLAIQRGASGPGGATSLTPEEQQRVDVHRDTQKFNIQADAEKRAYEIVHSSLEAQLKDVKDFNEKEKNIDKDAYAKELQANNERFKNKIFQYEAFKKNKEFIDKKYGVILSVEDEIKKDEEDITRIRSLYDGFVLQKKRSDEQLKKNSGDLADEKGKGGDILNSERFFNEELGRNNAFNDAIKKAKKDLDDAENKREDNKVKAAKARYEQLIQFEKEYSDNKKRIQEELWNLGSILINSEVDNKLRAIQLESQTRDEQASLQEKAIEDSSLDAKNKAALDIQLTQQKIELDKQAALEERKIKHEAAVRDRQLAIAHVTWNGIESVTAALKLPPPAGEILAAQRAILSGIQLAQLLATEIPAFAQGTGPEGLEKTMKVRHSEEGPEIIKKPGQSPYLSLTETVETLPKGTQIIPTLKESPVFDNKPIDESWEQTRFLAKYISKSNKKEIKNVFSPTIIVDMGFENRKRQILGN